MPLKLHPPRKEGQSWRVRGSYLGVYVNRATGAFKRAVAQQVLKEIEGQIERGRFSERGELTFAAAARAYVDAGGEWTYIRRLNDHFGDTPLSQIDQAAIDRAANALYPDGTPATRNRSCYTPVCAVLRHAGVRIDLRRPRGSAGKASVSWLWPEQAEAIFAEAEKINPEFAALLITLCYTGLRLSEALGLTWNNVRLADGYAYIPTTKNDEPRAVFLPPVAVAALGNLDGGRSPETDRGRVFRFAKSGHLYALLRLAANRAGCELPERSAFHIFRHTYATWMRRYAGLDERGLVGTGAWKDRKSAARYAHVVVSEEAQRAVMLPTKAKKA
jgi:integrase